MPTLTDVKTVVIVLMENRSFDHMLGYLSLPPYIRKDVEGQSTDPAWLAKFANPDGGQSFQRVVKLFIRRISLPPFRLCFNPCAWLTSPNALEEAVGLGHWSN